MFGNGAGATDAQHVAVEFVHPVIVGKRALPALSLVSDAATLMGVARVVVSTVSTPIRSRCSAAPTTSRSESPATAGAPTSAPGCAPPGRPGLLTIALLGGDGGDVLARGEADHCLVVDSDDPLVVKEGHVTAYHLLWELVHVFFDSPEASRSSRHQGSSSSTRSCTAEGATPARCSTRPPSRPGRRSRRSSSSAGPLGRPSTAALATCAERLAEAFADGATAARVRQRRQQHRRAGRRAHVRRPAAAGRRRCRRSGLTNDVAVVTALSNDVSFDVVFSRQVSGAFGRPGDIALALSTSGGSPNVLAALEEADKSGMVTVGLAGYGGGRMAELAAVQHMFAVPSSSVHRVQEMQTTLYHVLWEATHAALAR